MGFTVDADFTAETGWPLMLGPADACGDEATPACIPPDENDRDRPRAYAAAPSYGSVDLSMAWSHPIGPVGLDLVASLRNVLGRDNAAAYRAGTCLGATLISAACEQGLGQGRFSPGLTHPTPSIALRARF